MGKYQVLATGRAEAEHICDCECCTLKRLIEVTAGYDAIIDAASDEEAEAQAAAGIGAALEAATPRGYWLVDSTVEIAVDVKPLDVIGLARLAGYPTLPGF